MGDRRELRRSGKEATVMSDLTYCIDQYRRLLAANDSAKMTLGNIAAGIETDTAISTLGENLRVMLRAVEHLLPQESPYYRTQSVCTYYDRLTTKVNAVLKSNTTSLVSFIPAGRGTTWLSPAVRRELLGDTWRRMTQLNPKLETEFAPNDVTIDDICTPHDAVRYLHRVSTDMLFDPSGQTWQIDYGNAGYQCNSGGLVFALFTLGSEPAQKLVNKNPFTKRTIDIATSGKMVKKPNQADGVYALEHDGVMTVQLQLGCHYAAMRVKTGDEPSIEFRYTDTETYATSAFRTEVSTRTLKRLGFTTACKKNIVSVQDDFASVDDATDAYEKLLRFSLSLKDLDTVDPKSLVIDREDDVADAFFAGIMRLKDYVRKAPKGSYASCLKKEDGDSFWGAPTRILPIRSKRIAQAEAAQAQEAIASSEKPRPKRSKKSPKKALESIVNSAPTASETSAGAESVPAPSENIPAGGYATIKEQTDAKLAMLALAGKPTDDNTLDMNSQMDALLEKYKSYVAGKMSKSSLSSLPSQYQAIFDKYLAKKLAIGVAETTDDASGAAAGSAPALVPLQTAPAVQASLSPIAATLPIVKPAAPAPVDPEEKMWHEYLNSLGGVTKVHKDDPFEEHDATAKEMSAIASAPTAAATQPSKPTAQVPLDAGSSYKANFPSIPIPKTPESTLEKLNALSSALKKTLKGGFDYAPPPYPSIDMESIYGSYAKEFLKQTYSKSSHFYDMIGDYASILDPMGGDPLKKKPAPKSKFKSDAEAIYKNLYGLSNMFGDDTKKDNEKNAPEKSSNTIGPMPSGKSSWMPGLTSPDTIPLSPAQQKVAAQSPILPKMPSQHTPKTQSPVLEKTTAPSGPSTIDDVFHGTPSWVESQLSNVLKFDDLFVLKGIIHGAPSFVSPESYEYVLKTLGLTKTQGLTENDKNRFFAIRNYLSDNIGEWPEWSALKMEPDDEAETARRAACLLVNKAIGLAVSKNPDLIAGTAGKPASVPAAVDMQLDDMLDDDD